eukprot:TRINITY_DN9438_c0_g1_i1.p1 TRINITY_DN9438_c0_g1~~TRINITY_DN9438_c0_g1_i1.p1  ORF type:complete len:467 (+),score=42.63 TRINITY_DN9438_c0_g1_i1:126-1526(+)
MSAANGGGSDFTGKIHPLKGVGVDPLYGAQGLVVPPAGQRQQLPIAPQEFLNMKNRLSRLTPSAKAIITIAVAFTVGWPLQLRAFRVGQSIISAFSGVRVKSLSLGDKTIYPYASRSASYSIHRFSQKYGWGRLKNALLHRSISVDHFIPTAAARKRLAYDRAGRKDQWRLLKVAPAHLTTQLNLKAAPLPPKGRFFEGDRRLSFHVNTLWHHFGQWRATHPLTRMADHYRKKYRIAPQTYLSPWAYGRHLLHWVHPTFREVRGKTHKTFMQDLRKAWRVAPFVSLLYYFHMKMWLIVSPPELPGSHIMPFLLTGGLHAHWAFAPQEWNLRYRLRSWQFVLFFVVISMAGSIQIQRFVETLSDRYPEEPTSLPTIGTKPWGDDLSEYFAEKWADSSVQRLMNAMGSMPKTEERNAASFRQALTEILGIEGESESQVQPVIDGAAEWEKILERAGQSTSPSTKLEEE